MAAEVNFDTATSPDIDTKGVATASSSEDASDAGLPTLGDGSPASREAFLASFTADENHRIMRKVDRKFLLIIGMMYILKNVRSDVRFFSGDKTC
jgi:hypothetical protein